MEKVATIPLHRPAAGSATPFNIKNAEADRLAHELAKATGGSLTEAVIAALRDRPAEVQRHRGQAVLLSEIAEIRAFVAALPSRDTRTADEIPGYDEFGLPR